MSALAARADATGSHDVLLCADRADSTAGFLLTISGGKRTLSQFASTRWRIVSRYLPVGVAPESLQVKTVLGSPQYQCGFPEIAKSAAFGRMLEMASKWFGARRDGSTLPPRHSAGNEIVAFVLKNATRFDARCDLAAPTTPNGARTTRGRPRPSTSRPWGVYPPSENSTSAELACGDTLRRVLLSVIWAEISPGGWDQRRHPGPAVRTTSG